MWRREDFEGYTIQVFLELLIRYFTAEEKESETGVLVQNYDADGWFMLL